MKTNINIYNFIKQKKAYYTIFYKKNLAFDLAGNIYAKDYNEYYIIYTEKDITLTCAANAKILVFNGDIDFKFKYAFELDKEDVIVYYADNNKDEIEDLRIKDIICINKPIYMFSYTRYALLTATNIFIKGYHSMPIIYHPSKDNSIKFTFDLNDYLYEDIQKNSTEKNNELITQLNMLFEKTDSNQ